MKIFKRIVSFVTAAGLCATVASQFAFSADEVSAATVVSLSPNSKYAINNGVFEGWGTSLCWWANRVGYSDELAEKTGELFFSDKGLHMNIGRFNIGGGDDPTHDHITRTDSNMPGYSRYENGKIVYDWNADANQRNVLMKAIAAYGDGFITEMFSNSPPYYMTNSGCTSGNRDAGKNNLKDDWYDEFADYMAEVCAHYENDWGVHIQSVEPFNEPYTNFWGAYSQKQEGCHFDIGNSESKMIMEMQRAMSQRNLNNTMIVASDETSIDTQIDAFKALSGDAKNVVQRIDTHTYGGSKRTELKNLALQSGKNLWMSEVDGNGTSGTNSGEMGAALWLSNRMRDDLNGMECSAWILWQAIDKHISANGYNGKKDSGMIDISKGFWGLAVCDHDKKDVILTQKYYAFGQYSRYIRPGYTMLKTSDKTVAAYDPKEGKLVIVATNDGGQRDLTFDLSEFGAIGDSVQVIRTSGSMSNGEHWKDVGNIATSGEGFTATLAPLSITTYILDGVKATSFEADNKIDVAKSAVTGSDPWKDSSNPGKVSTDVPQNVFDGNTSSFFDGVGNGWVQADLGDEYNITAIGYSPRSGYEYRCAGGQFFSSSDGVNWNAMYSINSVPSFGMHYVTKLNNTEKVRYIKYQVPEGKPDGSVNKDSVYCCNIAEIEVYGDLSAKEPEPTVEPTTEPSPEPVKGDVNDDGVLNTSDLVALTSFLMADEAGIKTENADLNGDGKINIIDFITLKSLLA